MVEHELPKLVTRVRFPLSAEKERGRRKTSTSFFFSGVTIRIENCKKKVRV